MAQSLKAAFQAAAVAAFNALGDIPESVTFRSKTGVAPTYNPTTGAVTDTYTDYTVSMVFTEPTLFEIQSMGIIQSNDMWALIPQTNLTPVPKLTDQIIRSSVAWNVVNVKTDPAEALWKMLIRKG